MPPWAVTRQDRTRAVGMIDRAVGLPRWILKRRAVLGDDVVAPAKFVHDLRQAGGELRFALVGYAARLFYHSILPHPVGNDRVPWNGVALDEFYKLVDDRSRPRRP